MPKLIIQIPCFNEVDTLPETLKALPRHVDGITCVEWLVIDDGSSDGTAELAVKLGVDHVVRLPRNQGLSAAFQRGLRECVLRGADVIVNTDADNQYDADCIPALVSPILTGEADMVVGARPITSIAHFTAAKKILQRFGSWVVRRISGTEVPDAPSGFRAFSRASASQLRVFNEYSYTLETIIQAGMKGMAVTSVPIRVNPPTRPSRLIKNVGSYILRQLLTILRISMTYRPFRFFATPGVVSFGAGFIIGLRFVVYYLRDGGAGHVQSLILAALLMGLGFLLIVVGLLADLAAVNRKLLESIDSRTLALEMAITAPASPEPKTGMPEGVAL